MDAITFFVVAASSVACALLVAVGSVAIVLWAGAAVISRSWKTASAWQKSGAMVAIEPRLQYTDSSPDYPGALPLRAMKIIYETTRERNEFQPHLGTGTP